MKIRKIIISLLIIILIATLAFYLSKEVLLDKFKFALIEKIESATKKGITIENIDYVPLKGISLTEVTFYRDNRYNEKTFYISRLYIKFPLLLLLTEKIFSPTISVSNFQLRDIIVNGSFGFSVKTDKKIETAKEALEAVESIRFGNFSVKNGVLNIKNINGYIEVTPKSIKTSGLRFILNDEACKAHLEILNPLGKLSSKLEVFSSKFNLVSRVKKEEEIYKIPEIKGNFLDSSFEFMGELQNIKDPLISLYGKVNIDIKDAVYLAPAEFKKTVNLLKPEGKVESSIYVKGKVKNLSTLEIGVKSSADLLKIQDLRFKDFYMDARIKNGLVTIPLLSAYPYKGTLASSMQIDLTDEYVPYRAACRLSNIDIAEFLKDTELGKRNIKGRLFSEFAIHGDAKNMDSTEGSGSILIDEANLGPMPLLTPLLGNIYGYFRHVFPDLKQIDITKGSCDFYIADRKFLTDNLALWGEAVSVHAKGYIDFDKNLYFEVENRFRELDEAEENGLQAGLQELIGRFGKLMSKAYLTGTLRKPKWKFEYLGGIENVLKGGLDKVLKDIFE